MIDTTPGTANPKVAFCSAVSEASGEDPSGSAWALRRMALVELPLPWPYNVLEGRNVPPELTALLYEIWDTDGADTGMIGIASDPDYSVDGMRRVIDLRQGEDLASTYHRAEYLVPEDELVAHLRHLAFEPDHPDVARHLVDADPATRDFLVCTHGAIDVCCATFGYPVYKLMRAMADTAPVPTRVWRSTHFGGHRFAATALEAPQGRYWGHLKPEMLSGLVRQTASPRDLRRHYRGWSALSDRLWQIAEAELLATAGWSWSDATITGITGEATEPDGGTLTIAFQHQAGDGEVDIEIQPAGSVETMDQSKAGELREVPQYEVRITAQRPEAALPGLGPAMPEIDSPLRSWLGRCVAVAIDRPLGSRHPRHPDIIYPINYGEIPGTEAGDGHPIDVYVLGVDAPVTSFHGEVIAIVVRHDDVEDKLVVARAGIRLSRQEIGDAVEFQERFFDSEVILPDDL